MAFRRARIPWAGLTIALALGMIVAGVGFPDAAMGKAAAISSESQERSVEGREPPKVKEFKGAEDRVSPPKPRKPVWPKPGQAEVELDDSAKWKSDGGKKFPLRPYRPGGVDSNQVWFYHYVVVKDGKVYDQYHPRGISIDAYKKLWDYSDAIDFGF